MKKYLKYSYRNQLQDFCAPLGLSLIMVGIVESIGMFIQPLLLKLIVQVLIGAVSYILISLITRNEEFVYIFNIAKSTVLKN